MTAESDLAALRRVLTDCAPVVVACSGGIDSLVLATVAHRLAPADTVVAHTVTPAVPPDGSERVRAHAEREGWTLHVVRSREFEDERYLANPTDRCYFCKSNLYDAIDEIARQYAAGAGLDGRPELATLLYVVPLLGAEWIQRHKAHALEIGNLGRGRRWLGRGRSRAQQNEPREPCEPGAAGERAHREPAAQREQCEPTACPERPAASR